MKRTELYELVWSKPMIHLAKEFSLSDVGLRKICHKHDIPTPPLGYWAKLAYGKHVRQTPLPKPERDTEEVHLVARPQKVIPPEIEAAQQAAIEQEAKTGNAIEVPGERPDDLHSVAEKVEKILRKARPDAEGFVHCNRKELPCIAIGPGSIDRTIIFIDTFIKAVTSRGHTITKKDGTFRVLADEEMFSVRFYETKDKKPHEPTPKELKKQAKENKWRSTLSMTERKVYPDWDYFPSGRLSLEVRDTAGIGRRAESLAGRWHDRRNNKLEGYLPKVMVALAAAPATVRHRRADEAEKDRIRTEEHERWCREVARRERAKKRRSYIIKKAEDFEEFQKLATLSRFLSKEENSHSAEPVGRVSRVMEQMVAEMRLGFEHHALNEEISKLELFGDDDPL